MILRPYGQSLCNDKKKLFIFPTRFANVNSLLFSTREPRCVQRNWKMVFVQPRIWTRRCCPNFRLGAFIREFSVVRNCLHTASSQIRYSSTSRSLSTYNAFLFFLLYPCTSFNSKVSLESKPSQTEPFLSLFSTKSTVTFSIFLLLLRHVSGHQNIRTTTGSIWPCLTAHFSSSHSITPFRNTGR